MVFQGEGVTLGELGDCARRLGRALRPGELVYLEGPLGAGKTAFVRALAEALSVTDPVRSPSFTIANIYRGATTVQHPDLYRLEGLDDEDALALEEYASAEAITLVEWPEAGKERLGAPDWGVSMEHESVNTRRVKVTTRHEDGVVRWREAGRHG